MSKCYTALPTLPCIHVNGNVVQGVFLITVYLYSLGGTVAEYGEWSLCARLSVSEN